MPIFRPTKLALFLASALTLTVVSCKPPVKAGGEIAIQAESSTPQVFDFATKCPPGHMNDCWDELDKLNVAFGSEQDRNPKSGSKKQRVLILSYAGAKNVSAAAPPTQPTIILHMANHGKVVTNTYGLKPSKDAQYYVTVKNDAGTATWTLWEVPDADGGSVSSTASGVFKKCDAHETQWSYSIGAFTECEGAPHFRGMQAAVTKRGMNTASLTTFYVEPIRKILALLMPKAPPGDEPGWVSCDGGCCTL